VYYLSWEDLKKYFPSQLALHKMKFLVNREIELISKSEVRYTGIFSEYNMENRTITLSSVKSFGTEDRGCRVFVERSKFVYEYIIFKIENIKNMRDINECPEENMTGHEMVSDSAILDIGWAERSEDKAGGGDLRCAKDVGVDRTLMGGYKGNGEREGNGAKKWRYNSRREFNGSNNYFERKYSSQKRYRKKRIPSYSLFDVDVPNTDYDLTKYKEEDRVGRSDKPSNVYDKDSSFYDNFSV
jgi:hypothetical protein